jgi:glycosyltransferase involved in cell wall biosynthesis
MEAHCKTCAAEIEAGNFDVLFANACTFLRTTPIAGYVKIPSSIYLGEPYRWFYEAMPELPWLTPLTPLQQKFTFRNVREYLQRVSFLNGVRIQARAELEYAKQFDRILVNSVFSRETILRTYNLEAKVCYLGINSDYYKPTGEQKEDIVVGLGTIYHAKGVDRAIRAIGTIAEDIRPELIWIGNGASEWELQDYQRLAKGLGVRFTPQIHISDNEVISYLSRATAMIYTSRLEPFGLAPLEANACGTPVVGIAEGGVKETIRNGINGFLACDDDPFVIGELLSRFCKDRQLALDMGKQARQHVIESWNMKTCADNIEKNLLRLLETG